MADVYLIFCLTLRKYFFNVAPGLLKRLFDKYAILGELTVFQVLKKKKKEENTKKTKQNNKKTKTKQIVSKTQFSFWI